jgi:hypothetical protein
MDAQGIAEEQALEALGSYKRRRQDLVATHAKLVAARGEDAALALRAKAVARFDDALALRLPRERLQSVMGAFASLLEREDVTRDGYLVGPSFVARTLYKARWNLFCGQPPDHAFEPIEGRAFYGWQALHSPRLALNQRLQAVAGYRKTGGRHVDEALGGLLYQARDFAGARAAFGAAAARTGSLRVRNYALGAQLAAAGPGVGSGP